MRFLLAALGLFGLTTAVPGVCPGSTNTTINNLSTARGLKLRVRLRDPRADLASPVQHQYVRSIHEGAGTNLVGFRADTGLVFYVNGTDFDDGMSWSIVSDGGTLLAPYGLSLHTLDDDDEDRDVQVARLDVGPGDDGVYVPAAGAGRPQLRPTGWLACNEPLAYYGGKRFNVLRRGGTTGEPPPEECVAVALLPECAELKELPEGALASHEFVREVSCYRDASKM